MPAQDLELEDLPDYCLLVLGQISPVDPVEPLQRLTVASPVWPIIAYISLISQGIFQYKYPTILE
jgi:hypothetical protein